jgi:elongation factor G
MPEKPPSCLAMLYTAGAAPRLGRVDDGSSITDYDEEEIARKMSISTGLAYVEWGKPESKVKINLLDTPGFNMFVHEAKMVLPVVDAALVVVDGVAGVEVVTQRVWNYCAEVDLPRMIVVNRMDRDRADANRVLESLSQRLRTRRHSASTSHRQRKKSHRHRRPRPHEGLHLRDGRQRQRQRRPHPRRHGRAGQGSPRKLVELVAEGKDELMEEFFETGTIPEEHLVPALHEAIREDKLFPVLFTSGLGNVGVDELMDFIVDYTPAASEHHALTTWTEDGSTKPADRKGTDNEPASVYVFKTMSDAFAGRISYFKVFSGVLKNDASLQNYNRGTLEKFAHISLIQGKQAVPINELHAGDIGAVAKLKETLTGDTLGDKSSPIRYPAVKLPEPAITFAIEPKSRADEDKLGVGLHKLMEEDAMLRFFRDPQTKEFLIAGTGQQHIEVVVSKMKKRYHAEVVLKAPKVPYRETIRGKADVQGRHKKQTGGHGQYGDCKIKMEPCPKTPKSNSSSSTTSSAEPSHATSSPPSKKESKTPPPAAISPDIPSWISE